MSNLHRNSEKSLTPSPETNTLQPKEDHPNNVEEEKADKEDNHNFKEKILNQLDELPSQQRERLNQQMQDRLKQNYKRFYTSFSNKSWDDLNLILSDLKDLATEQLIRSIVVKSRMIPDIVYLLTDDSLPKHYHLQCNALLVLANLTAGTTEDIASLVEKGCIPVLTKFLTAGYKKTKENVLQALLNIAKEEDPSYRRKIARPGVIAWLSNDLDSFQHRPNYVRIAARFISKLFRNPFMVPMDEAVRIFPTLSLWAHSGESDIVRDALSSWNSLCETQDERVIQDISKSRRILNLLKIFKNQNGKFNLEYLGIFDHFSSKHLARATPFMNASDLEVIRDLLFDKNVLLRIKVCRILSGFLAHGISDPGDILTHEIFPRMIELALDDDIEMREKALECIMSFVQISRIDNMEYLVSQGLVSVLQINFANKHQNNLRKKCQLVVSKMLEHGENIKIMKSAKVNDYAILINQHSLWTLLPKRSGKQG